VGADDTPGAATLLAICWALWNGAAPPDFQEVLSLPPPLLRSVGSLLEAVAGGPEAVDEWLAERRSSARAV
jgi:hypothetical protein